ncbi:hypothetical protein BU16DRAFT_383251 [Lophium mytilinum]|uniref:Uncharacterized protein n=1 Tax=Lophium mytilinum TaxID=390894 RepID=A0A6A6QTZ9_9PEZI|nr:hypothetical protein BU16DRAFT_383251 [Lophium mytilinum]
MMWLVLLVVRYGGRNGENRPGAVLGRQALNILFYLGAIGAVALKTLRTCPVLVGTAADIGCSVKVCQHCV